MRILICLLMLLTGSAYAANSNSYIQQYEDGVRKAIEEYMERLKEGDSPAPGPGQGEILLPKMPEQAPAPAPLAPNAPPPANIYR